MPGAPAISLVGNLTADPELRFTAAGKAVANVSIATTPRTFDRASGDWVDGTTWFVRGSVFDSYAENVSESLRKGMQVVVIGELVNRAFTDKEGNDRETVELRIGEIGPALRFAQAEVTKIRAEDAASRRPAKAKPVRKTVLDQTEDDFADSAEDAADDDEVSSPPTRRSAGQPRTRKNAVAKPARVTKVEVEEVDEDDETFGEW